MTDSVPEKLGKYRIIRDFYLEMCHAHIYN